MGVNMNIQTGIVAILDKKKKIIGTGFLLGKNLILTYAPVVKQATAGLIDWILIHS